MVDPALAICLIWPLHGKPAISPQKNCYQSVLSLLAVACPTVAVRRDTMTISPVDIAWEAVTVLRDLSNKALGELERHGGKLPDRPDTIANAGIRAAMLKFAEESIAGIIAVSAGRSQLVRTNAAMAKFETLHVLIELYRTDPRSSFAKLKYGVRKAQGKLYTKIDQQIGEVSLNDVTVDHVMGWYKRWSAGGKHLPTGYSYIQMIKALLRYGAAAEDQRCVALCGALRAIHFPHGNKTVRRIDRAQADVIRAMAHTMKSPSLALAQAFQFDLKLYDGQSSGNGYRQMSLGNPPFKAEQ
jgi:hypothetical protein